MTKVSNFTEGKIFSPLVKFTIPILMGIIFTNNVWSCGFTYSWTVW